VVLVPVSLYHVENRVSLSCGVLVIGAAWHVAMRIMVGVGHLVQRTEDGHIGRVLCGRMIGTSGDIVCGLYRAQEDEERGFLG
jgi:hypothetical protein